MGVATTLEAAGLTNMEEARGSAGAEGSGRKEAKVPTREEILKGSVGKVGKSKKSGIVYLSRVPPHLKPMRLKQMLSVHGKVDRVYLSLEHGSGSKSKNGKKQGKSYSEGWIEFVDKKVAKHVARLLNGEPMGGRKKRSKYYYDLWNLKYLPGFKWENLTEDIAYKRRVRDQKLAQEVSAARKERDFYLSKVDQAKVISEMEKRKREHGGEEALRSIEEKRSSRVFPQKKARPDPVTDKTPRLSKGLLSLIGGKGAR